MLSVTLIVVVILALGFDFINGFHDTANSIATSVSTRVLTPAQAIAMAATLDFLGALTSSKVAKTVANDIVNNNLINQYVIISALVAAIIWNLITWYFGIPSSSSHALMGALIGSSISFARNFQIVKWHGVLNKIVIPLLSSPLLGFFIGFLVMKLLYTLLSPFSQRTVNKWFSKLQILSAAIMSFSHGMNDAQKSMGIITLALITSKNIKPDSPVPIWVKAICALAMAIGVSTGGWKIIKTMGDKMIKLQPINGFAAEATAATIIQTASLAGGIPVSTTHIISSSIMGVGAAKRLSAVRWPLARSIVTAWVLTIPVTIILGALITTLLKLLKVM